MYYNYSYGYAIYKKILEKSDGLYELLKEATIYASFKRLEKEGYIKSYWGDESQGGRRKYYHITLEGEDVYKENKQAWKFTKKIIDKLLQKITGAIKPRTIPLFLFFKNYLRNL